MTPAQQQALPAHAPQGGGTQRRRVGTHSDGARRNSQWPTQA
jgi:hypothetical protein